MPANENPSPDHPEILKSIAGWAIEKGVFRTPAIAIVETWEGSSLAVSWVKAWLNAEGGIGVVIVMGGELGRASTFGGGHIVIGGKCTFAFLRHGDVPDRRGSEVKDRFRGSGKPQLLAMKHFR